MGAAARQDGNPVLLGVFGGWTLSSTYTYRSGTAENPAVGSDVNVDGNSSSDRPFIDGVMAERNSYEGANYSSVNMRMSKRFRFGSRRALLLQFEAFNLFNRTNFGGLEHDVGDDRRPRATPTGRSRRPTRRASSSWA